MIRACLAFASLFLTATAWATSSFQDLTVGGTVTVQGSAFSVGTSSLAVAAGKVGIGTASPSSRLELVDGDIRITTTTGSRGIIFQDGTTQVTAGVSGTFNAPAVFNSSLTVNGSIFAGWEMVSHEAGSGSTSSVTCGAGKRLVGGGCLGTSTGYYLIRSGPSSNTGWQCEWNGVNASRVAYAICARFESN